MNDKCMSKKEYKFGGVKEYSLEEIEAEILKEKVYLDVFAGSDVHFKKDIKKIENVLTDLKKIPSYKYRYKINDFPNKKFPIDSQIGFLAQDIEQIFPEATKSDQDGYLYVNYQSLIPVLFSAVNELSDKLNMATKEIEALKLKN